MQRILCLLYVLANIGTIMGESTQRFKDVVTPLARDCMSEVGAIEDDFQTVINRNRLESRNAKCLLACVYRQLGAFNDTDRLKNGDSVMPIMDKLYGFQDFGTVMKTQVVHNCVNEVNGADDDRCELVMHFLHCVIQHY
ncbi:general odorant-binding protein 19d-like [Periplaneta americana]|uniref:general odorant-binding protein 19d-like n=1 Tax=Periplaneta americana TaxID=6978 RepID=UPI0037E7F28B